MYNTIVIMKENQNTEFKSNFNDSVIQIADLSLQSLQVSWDSYPAPNHSIDDLDLKKAKKFIQKVNTIGRFKLDGSYISQKISTKDFRFTDNVTDKVTNRVPNKVTDKTTNRVTNKVTNKVTNNQKIIFENIIQNNWISINELALKVGISTRKVKENIHKLKVLGKLKRIGPTNGGHWEVV